MRRRPISPDVFSAANENTAHLHGCRTASAPFRELSGMKECSPDILVLLLTAAVSSVYVMGMKKAQAVPTTAVVVVVVVVVVVIGNLPGVRVSALLILLPRLCSINNCCKR